jgi:hypothetical protein
MLTWWHLGARFAAEGSLGMLLRVALCITPGTAGQYMSGLHAWKIISTASAASIGRARWFCMNLFE